MTHLAPTPEQKDPSKLWEQQVLEARKAGNYNRVTLLCEQVIESQPDNRRAYWHLGLIKLLHQQDEEAQFIWMSVLMEAPAEEEGRWTHELVSILDSSVSEQINVGNWSLAQSIRQCIHTIAPDHLGNGLQLIQLSLQLNQFHPRNLVEFNIIDILASNATNIPTHLLLQTIHQLPDQTLGSPEVLTFVKTCLPHGQANPKEWIDILLAKGIRLAKFWRRPKLALRYGEWARQLDSNNLLVMAILPQIYYATQHKFDEGIALAEAYSKVATDLLDRLHAGHLLIDGYLMKGRLWEQAQQVLEEQVQSLEEWLQAAPEETYQLESEATLCNALFSLPYFDDHPVANRSLQNNVGQRYQQQIQRFIQEKGIDYQPYPLFSSNKTKHPTSEKIRIGYLSSSLHRHSVGWLCRWLFHHHNRDKFEIYTYFNHQLNIEAFSQQWFVNNAHQACTFDGNIWGIAQTIQQNNVDILVDLDSLTNHINYGVLALKPAPIQVSWLGLDAPGLPAIDYFIADPYVLPENAQEYYSETLWCLPQTYLSVDGFEVWVPTLSREDLNIPQDAVVYFTAQKAFKRHPQIINLQLQILRDVPNSYLLVKGIGDSDGIKQLFFEAAEKMGVASDRFRFLGPEKFEESHRANIGLADVVLDTFPYNGATTTMETLWMEVPLVTKVGQQFAARNSYTMMVNAGISEGIAWSDDEYVDWGIRLGKDETLRNQIRWKIHQSKRTAPLWNAKQFTRQMEDAYEQMWALYCQGESR